MPLHDFLQRPRKPYEKKRIRTIHSDAGDDVQCIGNLAKFRERKVSLASLYMANIGAIQSSLRGQFFLRIPLGLPDVSNVLTNSSEHAHSMIMLQSYRDSRYCQ